jgi:hypothetical protein
VLGAHERHTPAAARRDSALPKNRSEQVRDARELGPLLVSLCRRDAGERLSDSALRVLDDAATRERFIDLATAHGVLGLALATLQRVRPRVGTAGAELQERLRGCRRRAAAMELGRDRVLAVLRGAGITPVVLKGAGLATTVFREPAERGLGDIDLLLAEGEIDRAVSALGAHGYLVPGAEEVEAGYREHHFHVRVQRPDGIIVELHWKLTRPMEPFLIDPGSVLRGSVLVRAPVPMRVPRPEHALLHTVLEIVREFDRLTRIVDVDRIVSAAPAIDWRYLEETARKARLLPSLALALELSRDMLGTAVPDEVRRRIRPPAPVRLHLALLRPAASLLRQRAVTRPSWLTLFQLWLLSGERRTTLVRMARGDDTDPLDWIWRGDQSPDASPATTVHPLKRMTKLAVYQLGLYVRGVAGIPRSWSGVA